MKGRRIAAVVLACFPAAAPAQTTTQLTIDDIFWPDRGKFPAYSAEIDESKVQFSIFGGVLRDSNPFRLSDSTDTQATLGTTSKADTVSRAGVGLKADLPFSRQRLLLDLQVQGVNYHTFDVLDHTAYRASGAWNWQAGDQWSGAVGYSQREFLASLADIQAPIKDMITENYAFAGGGFRFTPRWRVRGLLDWIKWDHSDPSRDTLDASIYAGTVGLDYVTPLGNSVGVQSKYSVGDYPNRQVVAGSLVDNSYYEIESSAVMHWIFTSKSVFDARAGYTSRRQDQVPQRDFDGFTGRVIYDWFIGPKTLLNFAVWREIRSTEDVSASYILSEGWGIGPAWAPTSKIVLQVKYIREDRDYRGDPGFVASGTPPREDKFRGGNITLGYTPRRNIQLSVSAEGGDRESNTAGADYDYGAVSAYVRFLF
ncbi:MAG TPA: XrtB/PEP-CTERM-associated polysaccharide biosynthesis outer membrane protein EpsL [Burkholderiales bacterium]|nr:XrtB/PEP-CTERM-associated polysaccharide biosynthesis outer membrane protein EpsL [Burkholderiales bacterium]